MRSQGSNPPEASSNTGNSGSRHHQQNASAQHDNEETDNHLLADRVWNLEGSTAVQNLAVSPDRGSDWQGQVTEVERENQQQSSNVDSRDSTHSHSEGIDPNWQENAVSAWPAEAIANENRGQQQLQDAQEAWPDVGSGEAVENLPEVPADPPRMLRSTPSRRVTRFHPPDNDNVYSMELRELLSRLLSHHVVAQLSLLLVLVYL